MEILYKYRFHWQDVVLMVASVALLAVVSALSFAGIIPLDEGEEFAPWLTSAVTVGCVALFWCYKPRYVMIDREMLYVKCSLRTVQIPLRDIATLEPFDRNALFRKVRRIGMSGARMSIGRYTIPGYGKLEVITTTNTDMVMVTTKFGYRVVINCPIDALRNHPHYTRLNAHA